MTTTKRDRKMIPRRVKSTTLAAYPSAARKKTVAAPRVRKSLTPGTVAILLAGPYAGRRVVIVKNLDSGFLAVTGPYQWNGVPLRRAHPKFVIGTSTKIDITGIDTAKLTDSYFKEARKEYGLTATDTKPRAPRSDVQKADQKVIDDVVIAAANKVSPLLQQYIKTRFTLTATMGLKPHELKF